ncbi:MAG: serine--tRNA ligase [Thermoplasmatota archaeon]
MRFELKGRLVFSGDASHAKDDISAFLKEANTTILLPKGGDEGEGAEVVDWRIEGATLHVRIDSGGRVRAHDALLRLRKGLAERIGKKHRLGMRELAIDAYEVTFDVDRAPKVPFTIPFAKGVRFSGNSVTLELADVTEEWLQQNYVDRMLNLVREKIDHQYYEGKGELHHVLYTSAKHTPAWSKDPSEAMLAANWLVQGPTKGKWVFRPPAAAILRAMERIAVEEVLKPAGFQEMMIPHHVPFDVWLKSGHIHGVPNEIYYVAEPKTRDPKMWEKFSDIVKVTRQVPTDLLMENLSPPNAGICYAQCGNVYWSMNGRTIADADFPIKVFDRAAVSNRYESGGRHGIERVDEFHRIEPVYIGTREQLLQLRADMLERYKHVFNNVLELEWRVAAVTPFYMAHSGMGDIASAEGEKHHEKSLADAPETGTLDFEAWLPYRGSREESEWLEFQNLSIVGKKYTEAFNIKAQKLDLWSGCSGIGLERWTVAFLAQHGLEPDKWPAGFRKFLPEIPKGVNFL